MQHLLASGHVLSTLPAASRQLLTGRDFFPGFISAPFHQGLVVVFAVAAALAALAAVASLLRGGRYVPPESGPRRPPRRPPGIGSDGRYPRPRWWRGRRARESRADRAAATPTSVSESGAVKLRSLPSRCSAHSRCRRV